jgi:hypothetical protein
MQQRLTPAFILAATLAAIHGAPSAVHACSCIPQTLAQQYDRADYVLVGTVADMAESALDGRPMAEILFTVERQWKGSPRSQIELTVDTESASCGLPFLVEGGSFLLFLTGENILQTNLCAGNMPIDQSSKEFSELDEIAAEK